MTNNTNPTATADQINKAIRARYAELPPIVWNPRPADRSRNGRRIPGSVKHRAIR